MFKEIYKAANDDIKADDELIAAVLANGQKRPRRSGVYKYSSIAAVAAAVAVSITAVPSVINRHGSVSDEPLFETAAPVEPSGADAYHRDDANGVGVSESTASAAKTRSAAAEKAEPETKRQPETKQQPSAKVQERSVGERAALKKPQTDEITPEEDAETGDTGYAESVMMSETMKRKNVNTKVKTVVLHVNDTDYSGGEPLQSEDDAVYLDAGVYTPAQWSMDEYFEYLGENIFEKLSLPEDFSYAGDYEMSVSVDENNQPLQDSAIFPYEGENGRYVTVITSKNTLTASSYIEDERYVKSDIEGTDAVVIGGGENYKSYIISEDISHIVTSDGMNEDELGNLLVSIGGTQ